MCTPATTLHASRCLAANRLAIFKKKKKKKKQTRRWSNAPKQEEEEEEEERASRDRLDPM
jgi:hypothetical protein